MLGLPQGERALPVAMRSVLHSVRTSLRSAGRLRRLTSSSASTFSSCASTRPSAVRVKSGQSVARDQAVAMDAHEALAEFVFQRLQRFLDQHLAAGVMHDHVFVLGQQVVDFDDRNQHQVAAHARAQVAAFARRGFVALDHPRALSRLKRPARSMRRAQALDADRLEQVVDRVGIECGQRMFVVGGAEDHGRRVFEFAEVPRRFEPIHARHADVEQDQVGLQAFDRFDRFAAVAGFADHLDGLDSPSRSTRRSRASGSSSTISAFIGLVVVRQAHGHREFPARRLHDQGRPCRRNGTRCARACWRAHAHCAVVPHHRGPDCARRFRPDRPVRRPRMLRVPPCGRRWMP